MMSIAQQLSNLQTNEDGTMCLVPVETMESIRSLLSKPKGRKTKGKKDPLAPKKAINAYMLWLADNRSTIKASLLAKGEDAKPKDVLVEAGVQWTLVEEEERTPFNEAYEADKLRYAEEMESYSPSPVPTPDEDYDSMDIPDAPEGWNGPMVWTYISLCVRDEDRKMVMFQDFDEAIAAANDIEECGGITKTSTGYSLRKGSKCVGNPEGSRSGMASWTKMTSPKKAQKASPKQKKVVEEEEVAVVEEVVDAVVEEEEVAKKKTQKKTFKPKEQEPEPEPESEEEDEMEVEPVEIGGITYYKDDKDILWDPQSGEEVGKYVDGKLVAN